MTPNVYMGLNGEDFELITLPSRPLTMTAACRRLRSAGFTTRHQAGVGTIATRWCGTYCVTVQLNRSPVRGGTAVMFRLIWGNVRVIDQGLGASLAEVVELALRLAHTVAVVQLMWALTMHAPAAVEATSSTRRAA